MKNDKHNIELSQKDFEDICLSLDMRANWIETNNPIYSASDASAAGESYNALEISSMETIIRLRKLAHKLRKVQYQKG